MRLHDDPEEVSLRLKCPVRTSWLLLSGEWSAYSTCSVSFTRVLKVLLDHHGLTKPFWNPSEIEVPLQWLPHRGTEGTVRLLWLLLIRKLNYLQELTHRGTEGTVRLLWLFLIAWETVPKTVWKQLCEPSCFYIITITLGMVESLAKM